MESCIYRGHVRHRRFEPVSNEFRYPICYLYVDLDEWDRIIQTLPLMGASRWSICGLRRRDHLGEPRVDLAASIRCEVERQTGRSPGGPIRMLTLWSSLGFYFSPITLYFLFDAAGNLASILAEVSNTPWGERHYYTLWEGNRCQGHQDAPRGQRASRFSYCHNKAFHVSPFLDLPLKYHWTVTQPSEHLTVQLAVADESGNKIFDATLSLLRIPLAKRNWLPQVVLTPSVPLRVLSAIYFQAFRLWLRKVPVYAHPEKARRQRHARHRSARREKIH